MMKHTGFLGLLGLMLLAVFGCQSPQNSNEIVIGEFASLTGTTATFGQSSHRGLQLAIDQINQAGGVLGKKIRLQTEDTQSRPEDAASAVTKLISRDHVVTVIGEVASSRSLAGAPICQENRIPMVSPASTNPQVTQKGDYIFRICYTDPFQAEMLAKFAYRSLGLRQVAILKDVKNDYSIGLSQFFTKTFTELGGHIIAEQAYSEGDTDFKAQLTSLKQKNPQAIFLPGYYSEAALVIKQARELNMMMPFLGGDGMDSPKLAEIAGADALQNCYYSNHYTNQDTSAVVQNFIKDYNKAYHEIPDAMAALAYDAGYIVADAIRRAKSTDPSLIRAALATTKDFMGVTGKVTIDANRNAAKSIVILELVKGLPKYLETIKP